MERAPVDPVVSPGSSVDAGGAGPEDVVESCLGPELGVGADVSAARVAALDVAAGEGGVAGKFRVAVDLVQGVSQEMQWVNVGEESSKQIPPPNSPARADPPAPCLQSRAGPDILADRDFRSGRSPIAPAFSEPTLRRSRRVGVKTIE